MEELEAISVPGRKLCFAGSCRYPDTRAAALTIHKDNIALPTTLDSHLSFAASFLPKIKHPTATAPQNCQKIRSMWILFAINCCLWQREVPGCLVLPGEQIHYLPLHTVY